MEDQTQTPIVPTQPEDDRPPLWKQILGAVIGGGLALALYYGYEYAKPQVTAYLTLPVAEGGRTFDLGASNIADKTMDKGNRKRILSRGLRAAGMLQDNAQNDPSLLSSVDNHSLDIAWPGHNQDDPKYAEAIENDREPGGVSVAIDEKIDAWDKAPSEETIDRVMDEQMATKEMESEDAWEDLWGDIRDDESDHNVERSNAAALPDTGVGIGIIAAGAAGGAWGTRKKKRKLA
ncbi:MAG: hypothetical protein HOG89_03710 [Candidatus Peribacter sp.]|jgi:hypothetical protein|nr:hypothetical protein [Candidatus Peribacter sp.]MBT4393075.1 hypothetical protein [Candidatus Peribacter sp.]MBT4600873.1 hypothetical protein [Candidatus Peribacter sp.]MBT5148996.1 hypothetical protein [Candidatus Peribacter sp.]MBT5638324.1 hypothetical protein [Candidatus Peribacter sp.]